MGSQKNKKNHRNNHRSVYKKKKLPIKVKWCASFSPFKGSRIINMNNFQQFSNELALHSTRRVGPFNFCQEKELGLASIIKERVARHCTACPRSGDTPAL